MNVNNLWCGMVMHIKWWFFPRLGFPIIAIYSPQRVEYLPWKSIAPIRYADYQEVENRPRRRLLRRLTAIILPALKIRHDKFSCFQQTNANFICISFKFPSSFLQLYNYCSVNKFLSILPPFKYNADVKKIIITITASSSTAENWRLRNENIVSPWNSTTSPCPKKRARNSCLNYATGNYNKIFRGFPISTAETRAIQAKLMWYTNQHRS